MGLLHDLAMRRRGSAYEATATRQVALMYQQLYWQTPAPPGTPG